MIQRDSGWSVEKPYGHYSCYEEHKKTLTFTPDTTDEEINRVIAEERSHWHQDFWVKRDFRCIVHFTAICDSND